MRAVRLLWLLAMRGALIAEPIPQAAFALVEAPPSATSLAAEAKTPAVSFAGGFEQSVVSPRSIAPFSFLVKNSGEAALAAAWEVSFPAEWEPLGPVSGTVQLPPEEEEWIPLLCSIPADASPGPGSVVFVLRDPQSREQWARMDKPYSVLAAGRLVFDSIEDDRVAVEGVAYRVRRWLRNGSNAPVRVRLEVESSRGWDVELAEPTLDLDPQMGVWVEAVVSPPRLWEPELSHTLTLRARTDELPEGQREARVSDTTRVLSGAGGDGRPVLRGRLELEGLVPAGGKGGAGVNLRLTGDLTPERHLDLRIGEALPIGGKEALARRATYLDVADDRWGGLLVGRTSLGFTRLTAHDQWGEWGKIRLQSKLGTLSAFSSLSEPDTLIGRMAGFTLDFPAGGRRAFGALAFGGESAANSPGSSFSVASLWGKGETATTSWEAEVAAGRLAGSSSVEPAWRIELMGAKARWTWGGESQGAAEAFPGTVWNHNHLWGYTGYSLSPSFQTWISGRRLRSPDLDLDPAADVLAGEAGMTWSGLPFGSVALSRSHTSFGATASRRFERTERLWNLKLGLDLATKLSGTASVEFGESEEAGRRTTLSRASYTLRYRPGERWLLQARLQPAPQAEEIFDFKQRWIFLSRWQAGSRRWVEVEGQQLRCGQLAGGACETEPTLRLSVGQALRGPLAGWRLIGFAQRLGGSQEVTAGLRLIRGLTVAPSFLRRGAEIVGTLRMPENSRSPEGIRVSLGERTAFADSNGVFRFAGVPPGEHLLLTNRGDLGLSLVPEHPLPVSIRLAGREPQQVDLRLVRPGRIEGPVLIEEGPRTGPSSSNDEPLVWEPFQGLGVHFQHTRWPHLHEVAVSDRDGRFSVVNLLPGPWRVSVHEADVPRGNEVVWNEGEVVVDVVGGETVVLDPISVIWPVRTQTLQEVPPLTIDASSY